MHIHVSSWNSEKEHIHYSYAHQTSTYIHSMREIDCPAYCAWTYVCTHMHIAHRLVLMHKVVFGGGNQARPQGMQ